MTNLVADGGYIIETGGADGLARGRLIVDEPQAGYYLARSPYVPKARLHKDQIWVPARIWWSVPEDPDDFGELDTPPLKPYCEVDGREVDAYAAWPYLAGNPITREEYEALKADLQERRGRATEPLFDDSHEHEPNEDNMNIDAVFPSKYISAADLQGRELVVAIERIDMETIGNDRKPILYFRGGRKGLVLNKTNSGNIKALFGAETDNWSGQKIVLFPAWVEYQGKQVEAVRVRAAPVAPRNGGHAQQPTMGGQPALQGAGNAGPLPQGQPAAAALDDDIPFAAEWRV